MKGRKSRPLTARWSLFTFSEFGSRADRYPHQPPVKPGAATGPWQERKAVVEGYSVERHMHLNLHERDNVYCGDGCNNRVYTLEVKGTCASKNVEVPHGPRYG